ncbi:hypothetical protein LCGC14_2625320, partial [marine sediment metagenome]
MSRSNGIMSTMAGLPPGNKPQVLSGYTDCSIGFEPSRNVEGKLIHNRETASKHRVSARWWQVHPV